MIKVCMFCGQVKISTHSAQMRDLHWNIASHGVCDQCVKKPWDDRLKEHQDEILAKADQIRADRAKASLAMKEAGE